MTHKRQTGSKAASAAGKVLSNPKSSKTEKSAAASVHHVLERIAEADTVEKLEALLPWNADLEPASKTVAQYR